MPGARDGKIKKTWVRYTRDRMWQSARFRIQKRYQVAYNFYGSYKFYGTRLREKHGKAVALTHKAHRIRDPISQSHI